MARKKISLETIDRGLLPPKPPKVEVRDDPIPETEQVSVPDAQVVFDAATAQLWLRDSWRRLQGTLKTAVFLGEGVRPSQLGFSCLLAQRALKAGGVLFVPEKLLALPELKSMIQADEQPGKGFIALVKS